jgi:uncharacterized protein GlcG (DUF336 family)
MTETFTAESTMGACVKVVVAALSGADRKLSASELEVATLDRSGRRRCFRRLDHATVARMLG